MRMNAALMPATLLHMKARTADSYTSTLHTVPFRTLHSVLVPAGGLTTSPCTASATRPC